MTQFLSNPKFQALDSNGDPLSGGKVYTYDPGTTTNRATYPTIADALAATNANANPVVLDSRGEADIVLAGATKFVLKDSADTTIWTLDNIDTDDDMLDANGNEIIAFSATASAVNHLKISNAATGNNVTIDTAGDDATPDLTIQSAGGSGSVTVTGLALSTPLAIDGTASSAAELRLAEDTDNGTNYIGLIAPSAVTSSVSFILPDGDGTTDQILKTDGSLALGWDSVDNLVSSAGDATAGLIEIATQAEQETGTSTTLAVTPGRQQYHQSACKGWVAFDGTGVVAIDGSYNVTSVTDNGVGDYTITWDTDFSDANYSSIGMGHSGSSGNLSVCGKIGVDPLAGTFRTTCYITSTDTAHDPAHYYVAAFGDQ